MSTRYGLPTDAELWRLGQHKLVAGALALTVAGVLSAAVALTSGGIRISTVLFLVAGALFIGNLFTIDDTRPGELTKREVLTAGSRRRRRRLRWSLLRGRTDDLDDDDRQTLHHLAPVVRARAGTLLLVDASLMPIGTAYATGMAFNNPSANPWIAVPLIVVLSVVVFIDIGLRVTELRAAGRYLAAEAR